MKRLTVPVLFFLIAACGESPETTTSLAADVAAAEVSVCSCVNEPILTTAKANACTALMESKTSEEITLETMACRATSDVPEGGPDLCYCLQTANPDPSVAAACQAIIPENISPVEMSAKLAECSRQ